MTTESTTTATNGTGPVFSSAALVSGRKFNGTILSAQMQEGDYGLQLVLQCKNLDRPERAEPISIYVKYSDRRNSKWGVFLKHLENLGVHIGKPEELVGMSFTFDEVELDFGKNQNGEPITATLRVPLAKL